ncbi:MAG: hypothetical protein SGJ17_09890 [Hyphomicrobiales bacterium]|nr:hypothetical protein [Hyphomicrobiales bacterium]
MKLSAILSCRLHGRIPLFALVVASVTVFGAGVTADDRRAPRIKAPKSAFAAKIALSGSGDANIRTIIVHVQNTDEAEQTDAQIKRFIKLFAQKARLDAERLGSAEVIFPVGFEMASNRAQTVAEAERRVFLAKRAADETRRPST